MNASKIPWLEFWMRNVRFVYISAVNDVERYVFINVYQYIWNLEKGVLVPIKTNSEKLQQCLIDTF